MLEQTLESWRQTDFVSAQNHNFVNETPLIQLDTNQHERRQERQEHNSLAALKLALGRAGDRGQETGDRPDFILFMEDDIVFNRHLRHNLEHWAPLRHAERGTRSVEPWETQPGPVFFFASLYDCTIRELERHDKRNYFIADPEAVYGSQCYVLSVALAEYIVEHWWEVPGMQDIKMSRLAARRCPIHYHTPSLVQHVGVVSAWGGRFHDTKDFNAEFRQKGP
jgi:hypothetical protein